MFRAQIIFILPLLAVLAPYKSEHCKEHEVIEIEYVADDQPVYVPCPLNETNFSVTWFKNGSQTEITSDRQTRVHQNQGHLKFIPAKLQDEGFYSCVLRNSTYCIQRLIKIQVFKNDDGLCYTHNLMYPFKGFKAETLEITCPSMRSYVDVRKIKWFKECQALDLDSGKYSAEDESLFIKNVNLKDSGIFTCVATFTYNGRDYKISRALNYTIQDIYNYIDPIIIKPTNNYLHIELGAALNVSCEVKFDGIVYLEWKVNDFSIHNYSEDGRVVMGNIYSGFKKHGEHITAADLIFSEVTEKDYNRKFYCQISSSVQRKAYIILKPQEPNYLRTLIAFVVAVIFVTVIAIIAMRFFKVEIVLWYRSSCCFCVNRKDGKKHDAYIMYPKNPTGTNFHGMNTFVLKVLPKVLEKQCDYRLFIVGRDDLPGQEVADLVEEAISQSRRLIIVLGDITSENSLGHDFEQKIAMYDALIRNKIKVILIELEKITDYTYMPESIKYIKQKQGVVRWKGQFTEANLQPNTRFWKNVRYLMPPAQHPSDKESMGISHTYNIVSTVTNI